MSGDATLVVTAPDWLTGARRVRYALEDLVEGAKEEILIVGYEISDIRFIRALADRSAVGVSIQVFVDHEQASIHDLYRNWPAHAGELIIWEGVTLPGGGHASLHAKAVLVDQTTAMVGSANLTYSGMDRNVEIGVVVTGPVVGELRRFIGNLVDRHLVTRVERLGGHS